MTGKKERKKREKEKPPRGLEAETPHPRSASIVCVCGGGLQHHGTYVEARGRLAEVGCLYIWVLGSELRLSGLAAGVSTY